MSEEPASAQLRDSPHRWLQAALLVISLVLVFGPSLLAHGRQALDRSVVNDDVRAQIYPFLRYEWPGRFRRDYIGDYFLGSIFPIGYRELYGTAGRLHLTVTASRIVPYALLLVIVFSLARTAWLVGGPLAAWLAAALCLGSPIYLAHMTGGVPRAFGFPVVAAAMLALATGSVWWLGLVTVLGFAFYPVAGMLAAISLALLLASPGIDREGARAWSPKHRAGFLALIAAASGAVALPMLIAARPYGPRIRNDQIAEFPEAGPGGRYRNNDRAPYKDPLRCADTVLRASIPEEGPGWWLSGRSWWLKDDTGRRLRWALALLLLAGGAGWLRLAARDAAARRVLLLLPAAFLGDLAARVAGPYFYIPQRYLLYSLPLLAAVILAAGPAGWATTSPATASAAPRRRIAIALSRALTLFMVGGIGAAEAGWNLKFDSRDPVYDFLTALPDEALVAGWPSGIVDNVPYVCRRNAFLTFETHQALHARYTLEMRRRMRALVDAYFATEPGPLLRLRDEFGVTHLVVDLDLLGRRDASYFRPFDEEIRAALARAGSRPLEVSRWLPSAVFLGDRTAVLDLGAMGPTAPAAHP